MDLQSSSFYYDDTVYRWNAHKKQLEFGLILENGDYYSSDDELGCCPRKGEVRVSWLASGIEETIAEEKLQLVDRSLSPGDFVRRLTSNTGLTYQLGTCKGCNNYCTILIAGTQKVVRDVACRRLKSLLPFKNGQYVLYSNWIGMIEHIENSITIENMDGATATLNPNELATFKDIFSESVTLSEAASRMFYPGQQLWGPKISLKLLKWDKEVPSMLNKAIEFVRLSVLEYDTLSLSILWFCGTANFRGIKQPDRILTKDLFENIKLVSVFETTPYGIGNFCHLVLEEKEKYLSYENWEEQLIKDLVKEKRTKQKTKKKEKANTNEAISNKKESEYVANEDIKTISKEDTAKMIDSLMTRVSEIAHGKDLKVNSDKNKDRIQGSKIGLKDRREIGESSKLRFGRGKETTLATRGNLMKKNEEGNVKESRLKFGTTHASKILESNTKITEKTYDTVSSILQKWSNPIASSTKKRRKHVNRKPTLKCDFNVGQFKKMNSFKICQSPRTVLEETPIALGDSLIVQVLATWSVVEIEWQSGVKELVRSSNLMYNDQFDNVEFFPGDFVIESKKHRANPALYGSVNYANFEDRTVNVNWLRYDATLDSQILIQSNEEVSAYDINDHPTYNFKVGSCVIYLKNLFIDDDGSSKCGQIINIFSSGLISVTLANLQTIECYPQHLCFVFDHLSDPAAINAFHVAEQDSWETKSDTSLDENLNMVAPPKPKPTPEKTQPKFDKLGKYTSLIQSFILKLESYFEEESKKKELLESLVSFIEKGKPFFTEFTEFLKAKGNEDMVEQVSNSNVVAIVQLLLQDIIECLDIERTDSMSELLDRFYSLINMEQPDDDVAKDDTPDMTSSLDVNVEDFDYPDLESPFLADLNVSDEAGPSQSTTVREDFTKKPSDQNTLLNKVEIKPNQIQYVGSVPRGHYYRNSKFIENSPAFFKRIKKELELLQEALPNGILVKVFEDRIDLFSVLIFGPKGTPYEDGIFVFQIRLTSTYPKSPPMVHYVSFCSEKLNPNLYEEGRVCISLLGTWVGEGSEVWNPDKSNLLQLFISIQGLILVPEPYYNEAGYDKMFGTEKGKESSRTYNESVLLRLIQSTISMVNRPPDEFHTEILEHFKMNGYRLCDRMTNWINPDASEDEETLNSPGFSLFPLSKGFCLSVKKAIPCLRECIASIKIPVNR